MKASFYAAAIASRPLSPPAVAAGPLAILSPACTEGTLPELSADLELSECMTLPRRVVWRGGGMQPPIVLRQSMDRDQQGAQSTGTAIWAGALSLARYMESQGAEYWRGKHVVELGCGAGLAAITAAKLGASIVVATDGDAKVLQLAALNARDNLDSEQRAAFSTAVLRWGEEDKPAALRDLDVDIVLGADITAYRDAWPALATTFRSLGAPVLLAASERRANEVKGLRDYLSAAGLTSTVMPSPLRRGYAAEKLSLLLIERPDPMSTCTFWTEDEMAPEPVLAVRCTSTR